MRKTRVALLGALGLLLVGGISASTALASGPYWHVNGVKLTQGTKQLKLQNKGIYIQNVKIAETNLVTECARGISEGATIEGNGVNAGQGKGRLVFTQCKISTPHSCKIAEPITTRQSKAHLVTFKGAQSKYALLFEPQQGTVFSTYVITKIPGETCIIEGTYTVEGRVAAELVPKEAESQEGLVYFPSPPISTVFIGQEETKIGLKLFGGEFAISGAFGARLATNERFGVFGQ